MLSAFRNFAITFLVAALIFGVIAYFVVVNITDAVSDDDNVYTDNIETTSADSLNPDGTSDNPTGDGPASSEVVGTSFNFLVIGNDYQPDKLKDYTFDANNLDEFGFPQSKRIASADFIMLVRVDKEEGKFVVCPIPYNTRVLDNGIYKTLGSLYGEHGVEYLVEKAAFLYGLPIDYYVSVSISNFEKLVDSVGGINYYIPTDMEYTDTKQGLHISLKKGSRMLNGKSAANMLRFKDYPEGTAKRMELAVEFFKTVVRKYLADTYYTEAEGLFNKLASYAKTNFTSEDLAKNVDLIFASKNFEQVSLTYPGSALVYDGVEYFEPNTSKAWMLFEEYKFTGK